MGRNKGQVPVGATFDLDLEVSPDLDARADLEGIDRVRPAGTHRLIATYYDTAELGLLAKGVALRRRTGGADTGWHLALPAGRATLDVHRPAGRSGSPVPAELSALLRSLLRSLLRDRTAGPVVRLPTTRVVTQQDGEAACWPRSPTTRSAPRSPAGRPRRPGASWRSGWSTDRVDC
jgi:hypothetical protein